MVFFSLFLSSVVLCCYLRCRFPSQSERWCSWPPNRLVLLVAGFFLVPRLYEQAERHMQVSPMPLTYVSGWTRRTRSCNWKEDNRAIDGAKYNDTMHVFLSVSVVYLSL